jgi:hypothetical protein
MYELKRIIELMDRLSPEERTIYNCNPKNLDWEVFTHLNCYGYQKFVFKQDVSLPHVESRQLIQKSGQKMFEDVNLIFFKKAARLNDINLQSYFEKVLYSGRLSNLFKDNNRNQSENQQKMN